MAPRAVKPKPEGHTLKPKTEKGQVTKVKTEKPEKSKSDKKERDKGEKNKPLIGDQAMELIAEYLKTQNRPYSATEVSANLHGRVSSQVYS